MMMQNIFKEQAKPKLFDKLLESDIELLLQYSVVQNYEDGNILVQQGDVPKYLYLVIQGQLKAYRVNDDGAEVTIRLLQSGETCMEAVIFMGSNSPINVQTMGQTQLLMIPENIVKSRVLSIPQFSLNLLQIITKHYKNSIHQIDGMNIKSPLQRVGYYFLTKYLETNQGKQDSEKLEIVLPFKKQVIANYLGMTPETFSRTLKQMKNLGVDVEGDRIKLREAFALCHFCDIDAANLCAREDKNKCGVCPLH